MSTLIIQRETKSTEDVELTLPYYAVSDYYGTPKYMAITGKHEGLSILLYKTGVPLIGGARADELPVVHQQITEDQFDAAFRKAIAQLEAKRAEACPNYL